MLPFTRDAFLEVFAAYNAAIWPAQLVAYAAGLIALWPLVAPGRAASRVALALLALMWAWTGIFYHWVAFAPVNPAARLFAFLFIAQALLLAVAAAGRSEIRFSADRNGLLGGALIFYALFLYPRLSLTLGEGHVPPFGLTPCPLTLFTLGLLMFMQPRPPAWLLATPLAWALIGGSAAWLLQIPADWALLAAVAAVLAVRYPGPRRPGPVPVPARGS